MTPHMFPSTKAGFFAILLAVLSGCSLGPSGYRVRLDSTPQSALVDCETEGQVGYTPVNIYVPPPPEASPAGVRMRIPSCNATWVSGAKRLYPNEIAWNPEAKGVTLIVARPESEPGVGKDIDFDYRKKIEERQLRQRQDELDAVQRRMRLEELRLRQLEREALEEAIAAESD